MVPVKARSRLNKVLVSRFPLAVPLSAAVLLIFLACTSNSYGGVGYIVLEPFEQERGPQSMRRVTHHQTKPLSMHDDISSSLSYVNSFKKLGRSLTFLHIPKTAGTAIELAAGRSRVSWGSCLFKHRPKRKICHYPGGEECMYIQHLRAFAAN